MIEFDAFGPPNHLIEEIEAEYVSFGDVPFRVRITGGWSDWAGETYVVTRHIPGSDLSITQYLGRGPDRVTYELMFSSAERFRQFRALVGTEQTLILAGDAAAVESTTVVFSDRVYQKIENVLLVDIDRGSVERLGGHVIVCSATFQKDPS